MSSLDVVIAGTGPAGVAAAIAAAGRGLSVLAVDRAEFPRDKTCGDGLTTQALRLLEALGVSWPALVEAGYRAVDEVQLVAPNGREVEIPLPRAGAHAGVVTRVGLDGALVAQARAAGVDIREGCGVDDVITSGDGVKVVLDDGETVEARHLIAADGHWSPIRRALHPDAPADLGTWHAVRQYYDGVDDPRLRCFFYEELLPGYAWIFPLPGGGANVGFGVLRNGRSGRELKALWPEVLARLPLGASATPLGASATPRDAMRAWPIPTAYDRELLTDGPVLYAGDAARVVDPMSGEGIAQALETGMLAAAAIAAGGDASTVGARYRAHVDRALGRDLRFAAKLQAVLARRGGANLALATVDLTPWTRRNFGKWLFEGYPRALLLTPDRWRRGVFSSPGAYRV